MELHFVTAEDVQSVPLQTEGPMADIQWKFACIGRHLVIGNVRHHIPLIKWLLTGPLSSELPVGIGSAAAKAESLKLMTAAGNILHTGEFEIEVYISPPETEPEAIRRDIEQWLNRAVQQLAA